MKKKRECKIHRKWMLAIIPWGYCEKCGKGVREYLSEIMNRALADLPDGQTKKEIERLLSGKAVPCSVIRKKGGK